MVLAWILLKVWQFLWVEGTTVNLQDPTILSPKPAQITKNERVETKCLESLEDKTTVGSSILMSNSMKKKFK